MMKIILVGEPAVGKTNICKRFCFNKFEEYSKPSISYESIENIYNINSHKVKVCIWDTLGQERFNSVFSQYYRATNGAFFIFDLTNYKSFERIDKWVQTYKDHAESTNIKKYLVGNKSDLALKNNIEIKREDVLKKVMKFDFDGYYETSALNNLNITEMMEQIIKGKYYIYINLFFRDICAA